MVAIVTNLNYMSSKGDNITYVLDTHTSTVARYCNLLRQLPGSNSKVQDIAIQLAYGVKDADGIVLPQKLVMELRYRLPLSYVDGGEQADIIGKLGDIGFSDEGVASLTKGLPIGAID